MTFKPWRERTRGFYLVAMIFLFIIPLGAGFTAAVLQPWSDFWWDVTVKLFYVWLSWVLLCTIFGWHNHRFARLFPLILLINIACFLALVPLWRAAQELPILGWTLLSAHLVATLFAYIYSKEVLTKNYKDIGNFGRILLTLVILAPVVCIIELITFDLFTANAFKTLIIAVISYFINIFFVSLSIRFRDPDWNPQKDTKN